MLSRREVYILDKWKKQQVLMQAPKVSSYVPKTCRFDWEQLYHYLDQYQDVYIKPVVGSGGRGIFRISNIGDDEYRLQEGTEIKHLQDRDLLKKNLKKRLKGKGSYMIQQGIDLLTIDGKPVDFRVLLLKPAKKWRYMGVMGKQAARNKMVTNYCRGGKALPLKDSIKRSGLDQNTNYKQVKEAMKKLAFDVSQAISARYPHVRELGLDLALDKQGNLWVLEANTKPGFHLFQKHRDRSLYTRIFQSVYSIRSQYPFKALRRR